VTSRAQPAVTFNKYFNEFSGIVLAGLADPEGGEHLSRQGPPLKEWRSPQTGGGK